VPQRPLHSYDGRMDTCYRFHHYRLLPQRRALLAGEGEDQPVKLGGRAFDMLLALVERRDRVVGKHELLDLVWPGLVVEENNLQVQVLALRKLLGHGAIATIPGRGYRFTLPVQAQGEVAAAATPPAPAHAGNLSGHAPELLGREGELRELQGLIDAHAVVTVTGAGGIGKTRLAQGAAAARVAQQPVWWVELAALVDPALVPAAVGQALGLRLEGQADATAAVAQALQGKTALVVLDNAEHLLDGVAAFVAALRDRAGGVKLLVTSQEVMRGLDEQVFRTGPLALPAGDDLAAVQASGAVALFVARARQADPRFVLGDDNRAAVADICRRLDGIPLAIELAAARVPLLGVEGLRRRLDERFQVLTAGARAVMRRHQTLRAALEWSHGLLDENERVVLRRLAVFAGGFTLEAAQAVAADGPIDGWDVLEHLGALVDKSLVVAEGEGLPRYRMLETTRLYALERLAEAGETRAWLLRHAEHCVAHAEAQAAEMLAQGQGGTGPLARLDAERDNLMHALAWCEGEPGADTAALGQRLAAALRYWYTSRALLPLGLRQMQAALARAAALPADAHRVRLLLAAAQAASWTGQDDSAAELGQQALEAAQACGDAAGEATARLLLGHRSLDAGQPDLAERHLRAALEAGRALGQHRIAGGAVNGLVALAVDQGRHDEAWRLVDEELVLRRARGHAYDLVTVLFNATMVALVRDDTAAMRALLAEAQALLPRLDSRFMGQLFIALAAPLAASGGRWREAVVLYGAAAAQTRQLSLPPHALVDARQLRDLAEARRVLSDAAFEAAWAEGAALDADAAQHRAGAALGEAAPA